MDRRDLRVRDVADMGDPSFANVLELRVADVAPRDAALAAAFGEVMASGVPVHDGGSSSGIQCVTKPQ